MKKETKEKLIYKKESERTPTEKLIRDIACYVLVAYVATLAFFWVNSQVKLTNAQAELVTASLMSQQHMSAH